MKSSDQVNRRYFLGQSAAAAAGLAAGAASGADPAGKKLVVATMGLSRGMAHVSSCLGLDDVEIAYVCDIDDNRVQKAMEVVDKANKQYTRKTQGVKDFRKVLEDKSVDAITIAAPNHWHTPMAIMACQAGKHVYVEKPGSHNAREAELIVEVADKTKRVVQMGNQRRSYPSVIEAIDKLKAGSIGTLRSARTWYNAKRGSIGKGKQVPVPSHIDYVLWQGPAPEKPYLDNVVHYNWHWRWNWGGGELANNGPHALDVARWGLGVDFPKHVSCCGGRYHFQDDQETPDTFVASYDFGDKYIHWDNSSCHARAGENVPFVAFYGDKGMMAIGGGGNYKIYDLAGKLVEEGKANGGDKAHFVSFFKAIREGTPPAAPIADAQKSTMLCHLGNIAYRVGGSITLDPQKRTILNNKDALALWGREYNKAFEPKV